MNDCTAGEGVIILSRSAPCLYGARRHDNNLCDAFEAWLLVNRQLKIARYWQRHVKIGKFKAFLTI
jgi:hypothetical protein